MKKIGKKYVVLIIVLIIFILAGIILFNVILNSSLSPKKYQNKLFIWKDGDMFFTENFEMINLNNMEAMKTNRVIYFDENYLYSFLVSNLPSEDLTKSIESQVKYEVTGNQLNFILDEIAYSGYITKNGELELKVIGTTIENDSLVGTLEAYEVNNEYEYTSLKEMYIKNRNNAWNVLKENLIKEIGLILGNEKYEQVVSNNRYGFQYNPDDIEHPIKIIEKGQEYDNLIVKNVRKITDKMLSISLTTNEDSDSIFALVLDGNSSTITAEYSRVKVQTTNPAENYFGIYSKALTVEFEMNSTGLQKLEDNSTNNEEISNSSNDVESLSIQNDNDIDREQLISDLNFYEIRGWLTLTDVERQEWEQCSNVELKQRLDKLSEDIEIQEEYNNKYAEQLSEIFVKEINVELNYSEDTNYKYMPSNKIQPKAQIEYVAINESGICEIYYSVEMALTITDKNKGQNTEMTTKKYYKATNIHELDGMIKIDNYNTQAIQDEINNAIAIAENPIYTAHSSNLPYYFYNAGKYVLYYLPDENRSML